MIGIYACSLLTTADLCAQVSARLRAHLPLVFEFLLRHKCFASLHFTDTAVDLVISCGHTTGFYPGKSFYLGKISQGRFTAGFIFLRWKGHTGDHWTLGGLTSQRTKFQLACSKFFALGSRKLKRMFLLQTTAWLSRFACRVSFRFWWRLEGSDLDSEYTGHAEATYQNPTGSGF